MNQLLTILTFAGAMASLTTFPDSCGLDYSLSRNTIINKIHHSDSTVRVSPKGDIYRAGKFKRIWFGNNYREEWVTPVEIPVFEFRNKNGKMEIIKIGGNFQTRTLRLEEEQGKEWVLRSVDKDASARIPEIIRTDMAEDVVQDQMSASNPYAALAVPRIADAAGIYHTNPSLVYLKKESFPEKYSDQSEGIYLFEERPDGNWEDLASFGYSKNIVGTQKMIEKVTENQDSRVDQKLFLKSRLTDMLISDWDRYEDQWRWASFEENGNTIYRPVPRDRDMAFFVNEGILPWLSTRKFLLRRIQGLDYSIKDLKGLNSQAKHLDRRFLNELTRDDWMLIAKNLQSDITDQVIDEAINLMPEQIAAISGNTIKSKLKARRDSLSFYADKYYSILARKVDIVGTEEADFFKIERISNTETKVLISSMDKEQKPDKKYFERVFTYPETKEIMLYGLKDKDIFEIKGNVEKGIKINIIGGKDNDKILNQSQVQGIAGKTIVYDDTTTIISASNNTRKAISSIPEKYSYNYYAFDYNILMPLVNIGYTYDDGIFLGGGFTYTAFDFMRKPFASKHKALFKYSMESGAKELAYSGIYNELFNIANVQLHTYIRDPKYTQNYFGLGNETEKSSPDKDYHRVRIGEFFINPELRYKVNPSIDFSGGFFYQNSRIENTPDRYISDLSINELTPNIFVRKEFIGVSAGFSHDSRNNTIFPTSGMHWEARNQFYYGISGSDNRFNRIKGEISLFLSPWKSTGHVAAFRAGGAINTGDYDFYQANSLGSQSNLRGFLYSRYSGNASFYQNTDIRVKLSKVRSYITKGYFGLLLFNDLGRVWQHDEDSHKWHHGYGGGLWVSPYEIAIVTAMYEFSKDEKKGLFSIRIGFLF